jgi:hypothetical protein
MTETPQDLEARCRTLRADLEGMYYPHLWVSSLIELAGLERRLSEAYAAQRKGAKM